MKPQTLPSNQLTFEALKTAAEKQIRAMLARRGGEMPREQAIKIAATALANRALREQSIHNHGRQAP